MQRSIYYVKGAKRRRDKYGNTLLAYQGMCELYALGWSVPKLAIHYGVPRELVKAKLKELGAEFSRG